MKKIIMFEGDIETQGYFSRQMAAQLRLLGHEVYLYDLEKPWKSSSDMLRFYERHNTVVLSFNFHGMCQETQFIDEERQVYIWDDLQIPCINILADHPYYYYQLLAQRPKYYVQLSIDLGHQAFMERFFPEIRLGPFLPLAGTKLSNAEEDKYVKDAAAGFCGVENGERLYKPVSKRSIDILFTGNYASPERFEKYITRIDDEYTAFYYGMIDDLLADPSQTVEEVVERHMRREIADLTEEDLKMTMQNITFIDLYVRYYIRGEVIRSLCDGGIKVQVFGDKWDELKLNHPENLVDGDSIYSAECLQKICDSKIALNVLPWFKNGPHDRIFNTMLNGALCLTDSNLWLDTILKDGENCRLYDLRSLGNLPDMVREILSDEEKMQNIADAGYQLGTKHTWGERMCELSQWIENEL
ncbi:MAG: glycosyltransferase family 1 protein [Lachnospiraceae bacterium]|nr:glycosyltransferase family 1 protein [Lachnospiraceae bacterium]